MEGPESGEGSAAAYIAGPRRRGIGLNIALLSQSPRPFGHDPGHAFGRNAKLRLRHATVDALMVGEDQATFQDKTRDAVDDDFFAPELRDRGHETRQRPSVTEITVTDGIEKRPVIFRRVAMEEILQHVLDRRATAMRTVDV